MIDVLRSFLCLSDGNSGGTVIIVCSYLTPRERITNMEKGMIARTLWLEVPYCAVKEIRKIPSLNRCDLVFPQVLKNQNCDRWEDSAQNCLGSIVYILSRAKQTAERLLISSSFTLFYSCLKSILDFKIVIGSRVHYE